MAHLILWMILGLTVGSLLMGAVLVTIDEVQFRLSCKKEDAHESARR